MRALTLLPASYPMVDHHPPREQDASDRDDRALMARVKAGDVRAFDSLVSRLWPRTFMYAQHLARDRDRAYDVAQEAFARLWQQKDTWELSGAVRAWLFQTARNIVISEARKEKVRRRWEWVHRDRAVTTRTPIHDLESEEIRRAVTKAIDELPDKRKEAFTLFHLHGMSHREIADIMDIQPQSVANHLQRALADLRVSLANFFPGLWEGPGSEDRRAGDGGEA